MQFIHESRRTGLIHDEEQFLLASGHRHVKQSPFLRMRASLHFRQQQTKQRLFGNRAWKAFQSAGTAQQKNEVALQTLGFMRGHELDIHLWLLKEHNATSVLVNLEQSIAIVA